ncbi:Proteasome inhibitor PI31 subunit [Chelonia mydas]|uniref:Proteasome inhibitor PI31 subunit n=1 Tax=Chelonia mydas TaxID=8469 RepID=M7BYU3_CHEMY|nr:Proteasome inhibitor PI31 subunit [Chelonia mydas]
MQDCSSQQVADLTLTVADYIDPEHLDDFHRVYKNVEELQTRVVTGIISPLGAPKEQSDPKKEPKPEKKGLSRGCAAAEGLWEGEEKPFNFASLFDDLPSDQVVSTTSRMENRDSAATLPPPPPPKPDPRDPFAVGGDDLDPFGGRRGGMIADPLRSGFRRPLIDPSSGLPNRLPPGAVPPGARFDPFGPGGGRPAGWVSGCACALLP